MASYPTFKITFVVAPDRPEMTKEEVEEWVDVIVRGIGAVTEMQVEKNGDDTESD